MLDEALGAAVREAIRPLNQKVDAQSSELRDLRAEVRELGAAVSAMSNAGQGASLQIYLKPEDVAKALGVSRKTVIRWVNADKLAHIKLPGGGIRIPLGAVEGLGVSVDPAEAAE